MTHTFQICSSIFCTLTRPWNYRTRPIISSKCITWRRCQLLRLYSVGDEWVRIIGGMIMTMEDRRTLKNTMSTSATLVRHKSHKQWRGVEPEPPGERRATNGISLGTAIPTGVGPKSTCTVAQWYGHRYDPSQLLSQIIFVFVQLTLDEATKAPLFLTSALDGGMWLTQRPARLPWGKRSGTHCTEGRWAPGPVWMDAPTGFALQTAQPVAGRYTDWAHDLSLYLIKYLL